MKKNRKSIIKNTLILFLIMLLFTTQFVNRSSYRISINKQKELKSSLNTIIDVGQDTYVQHDENNKDVYLLSSEGEETTVYKMLNIKYTADKAWTMNGRYIDDFDHKNCSTAPDDYISVSEGETYFVRLYGMNAWTQPVDGIFDFVTPILFLDDDNNVIGDALRGTYTDSKKGVEFTIPVGATRMHITNFNNQDITVQKKITLNEQEFNVLKNKQDEIINSLESYYEDVKNDPILFDKPDKCYIMFCVDDSRISVDQYADLFISKNVPLCLASIAGGLLNMASNNTETRLDVALRVQENGGEVLVHNAPVVTNETVNDPSFMYEHFVGEKQKFNAMGIETNGIILAGGQGQIPGSSETAKWVYSLYKYSDLYGEKYNDTPGYNSVYYNERAWLGNYKNKDDELKAYIDDLVENKKCKAFYFHDPNEYTVEDLSNLIDYINNIGSDKVEIVTYSTLYEKLAKRESDILRLLNYTINIEEPKWASLPIDQTRTLNVSYDPIEASEGKTITWSSSDTNVATINPTTGEITAKAEGTTTITASNGEKSGTYTLTVDGLLGDSNDDSQITSYDAYRALELSADRGIEIPNDEDEVVHLDVNRDETVTAWDAYRILQYSEGRITEF